jgi:hypothetical protein
MTGGPTTIELTVFTDQGDEVELAIPAKFELCPRCRGVGSHVDPAVDGQGISQADFDQDPDFQESYFAGVYDVACHRCAGEKVIKVIDRDRATSAEKTLFDNHERELNEIQAEEEAERRAGC